MGDIDQRPGRRRRNIDAPAIGFALGLERLLDLLAVHVGTTLHLSDIKLPKGVEDGTRIRLSGKGEKGDKGDKGDIGPAWQAVHQAASHFPVTPAISRPNSRSSVVSGSRKPMMRPSNITLRIPMIRIDVLKFAWTLRIVFTRSLSPSRAKTIPNFCG